MAYYIGDVPSEDIVIEPARELAAFDEATATLYAPDGEAVLAEFFATIEDDTVIVEWPDSSPFTVDGQHVLLVTLSHSTEAVRERLAPLRLVVQGDDGWQTVDSARDGWDDAPEDDAALDDLLNLAKDAVLEYAPSIASDARPPHNYRAAQRMQAENLWNANRVNSTTGGDGDGSFILRPFPLDWQVKQMLRPKRALPVVVDVTEADA
jgi:hypothetical protein